jgi:cell division septal protein FtsQ
MENNRKQKILISLKIIIISITLLNIIVIILSLLGWYMDWYYGYFNTLKTISVQGNNEYNEQYWIAMKKIFNNIEFDLILLLINSILIFICFLLYNFFRKKV